MKRAFAIIMVLALLLPMSAVVPAKAAQASAKPFYMVNWQAEKTDYQYVYTMPFFRCDMNAITDSTTSLHIYDLFGSSNVSITQLAQNLKRTFDGFPEGARYINFPMVIEALAEDKIYLEKGTALVKKWVDEFFRTYKAIGGKLDGLNVDVEYLGAYAYYIARAAANEDPALYRKIVEDPRYATEVRPKLVERGFEFSTPNGNKSEIYSISMTGSANYDIWNAVTTNRLCEYINEACQPLFRYYPDANVSNYCYPSAKAWNGNITETGLMTVGGNMDYAGNTANQNFYLRRPYPDFYEASANNPKYIKPLAYNNAVYEESIFHSFMWEMMVFKNMYESADSHQISAWIAGYNYNDSKTGADYLGETPYYTESLYHIGLLNPKPFIGYVRYQDTGESKYNDAIRIISEVMGELTRVAGTADRKPISVPNYWNSSFVLSGMYAGGRNIWRITPDTGKVSVGNFKVKDQEPTFAVDGQTIIFPQGKILKDSTIYKVGSSGYWVETPANVKPVVINDTNRYSAYPSYLEDFESYSVGTTFNASTAKHKAAWQTKGILKIQPKGGGQALSMIGNTSLTQVKLPEKITAGDSYAKQQVWEVTVTVPSGGEMTLLTCGGNDGGFKISGGKIYYHSKSGYEQLSGVSIAAGGTYTLRREVDFRSEKISHYSVYDAKGNRLGGADNVTMRSVSVPVTTISITNAVGTAYIDDYKLYPTGVTTELKTYDAKTGIQQTNPTGQKDRDTGYRLSWMNASDGEKIVKLYNNGAVVEQVNMAPGQDGVLTGVVKGSSIKLSVSVENVGSVSKPDDNGGSTGGTTGGTTGGNTGGNVGGTTGGTTGGSTGGTTGGNTGGTTGGNTSGNVGGTTGGTTGGNTDGTAGSNTGDNVGATVPTGAVDATNPSGTADTTTPSSGDTTNATDGTTQPVDTESGGQSNLTGGQIALIVIASVLAVAGGAFALCWFVIKPEWLLNGEIKQLIAKFFKRH